MNDDSSEPRERWLDVLLEQSLRRPVQRSAVVAPPRPWLAAALVLLGLGVVFGVFALRRSADVPAAPMQDPQPSQAAPSWSGPAMPVTSQSGWDAVKGRVDRVRFRLLRGRLAEGVAAEVVTATCDLTGSEARDLVDLVPLIGTEAFDVARDESPRFDAWIGFEIDGAHVHAFVRFFDPPTLVIGSRRTQNLPDAWQQAVQALWVKANQQAAIARGVVMKLDELEQVPASTKAIRCPPLPNGAVARHLGRFEALEHLELVFTTSLGSGQPVTIQLPDVSPTTFVELRALPQLRHLRIASGMLNDERATELAQLPALRSLRIDGRLNGDRGGLTAAGLRVLAKKITALELVGHETDAALFEPWLEAGQLQSLVLFGDALAPELLARLVRIPTLRELGLGGVAWKDTHLQVLAGSRLERLRLEYTDATVAGLRQLPRSLRCLDLRRQTFDESVDATLKTSLPECRVLHEGEVDPDERDPFFGIPGTTRR